MRARGLVTALLLAAPALAAPPAENHPLLGAWEFAVPGTPCTETSVFRPDGRARVSSGAEVTESEFEVSARPAAGDFYEYRDVVRRSNGLRDCTGGTTPVGTKSRWFIRFSTDRNAYLMCREPSLKACFGPVRRQDAVES